MPGDYVKGFPDPANSPNEKFLFPATPQLWEDDLYRDLINNGVPHEIALGVARSVAQHEERKTITEHHQKKQLEWWANIHTHAGTTGGEGVFDPYTPAPFRYAYHSGGTDYYSTDNGYSWSSAGAGTSSLLQGIWVPASGTDGYHILPRAVRYEFAYTENPPTTYGSGSVEDSGSSSDECRSVARDPDTGLTIIVGGGSGSSTGVPKIWYNTGEIDYLDKVEWVSVPGLGGGGDKQVLSCCFTAEGYFAAVGRNNIRFYRSDPDDIETWDIIDSLPSSCNQIEYFSGKLFAFDGDYNSSSDGYIYESTDGGVSWSTAFQVPGTTVEFGIPRSNGYVLLIPTDQGLWRTLDGENFEELSIPTSTSNIYRECTWDGVTWLVPNGNGELLMTEDSQANDLEINSSAPTMYSRLL